MRSVCSGRRWGRCRRARTGCVGAQMRGLPGQRHEAHRGRPAAQRQQWQLADEALRAAVQIVKQSQANVEQRVEFSPNYWDYLNRVRDHVAPKLNSALQSQSLGPEERVLSRQLVRGAGSCAAPRRHSTRCLAAAQLLQLEERPGNMFASLQPRTHEYLNTLVRQANQVVKGLAAAHTAAVNRPLPATAFADHQRRNQAWLEFRKQLQQLFKETHRLRFARAVMGAKLQSDISSGLGQRRFAGRKRPRAAVYVPTPPAAAAAASTSAPAKHVPGLDLPTLAPRPDARLRPHPLAGGGGQRVASAGPLSTPRGSPPVLAAPAAAAASAAAAAAGAAASTDTAAAAAWGRANAAAAPRQLRSYPAQPPPQGAVPMPTYVPSHAYAPPVPTQGGVGTRGRKGRPTQPASSASVYPVPAPAPPSATWDKAAYVTTLPGDPAGAGLPRDVTPAAESRRWGVLMEAQRRGVADMLGGAESVEAVAQPGTAQSLPSTGSDAEHGGRADAGGAFATPHGAREGAPDSYAFDAREAREFPDTEPPMGLSETDIDLDMEHFPGGWGAPELDGGLLGLDDGPASLFST